MKTSQVIAWLVCLLLSFAALLLGMLSYIRSEVLEGRLAELHVEVRGHRDRLVRLETVVQPPEPERESTGARAEKAMAGAPERAPQRTAGMVH